MGAGKSSLYCIDQISRDIKDYVSNQTLCTIPVSDLILK